MGYIRTSLFLLALLLGATTASAQCGNTIAWNNPSCQIIGSGSVLPQWTVISRHGEYAQGETECNIPGVRLLVYGQSQGRAVLQSGSATGNR